MSGNRVANGETAEKDEAFKDVDVYTMMLCYHDKIRHTYYDLAHQFANVIKHMLNYMKNKTTSNSVLFNPAKREHE